MSAAGVFFLIFGIKVLVFFEGEQISSEYQFITSQAAQHELVGRGLDISVVYPCYS